MAASIKDVRNTFANRPLFDGVLSDELDALEERQRRRRVVPITATFHGATSGNGMLSGSQAGGLHLDHAPRFFPFPSSATPLSALDAAQASPLSVQLSSRSISPSPGLGFGSGAPTASAAGAAAGGLLFALPPKIMRPWSVEVLMRRGNALHSSLRHPHFEQHTDRAVSPTRWGSAAGASRRRRGEGEGKPTAQALDHEVYSSRQPEASPQRTGAGGRAWHDDVSPNAADDSDMAMGETDREAQPTASRSKHQRGHGNHNSTTTSTSIMVTADSSLLHEAEPLTRISANASEELVDTVADESDVTAQIERAALRRYLQAERLRQQGVEPPDARITGGAQTEELRTASERVHDEAGEQKLTREQQERLQLERLLSNAGVGSRRDSGTGTATDSVSPLGSQRKRLQRSTTKKSNGPDDFILPATGYQPYVPPVEMSAADTVWRRMLTEEKNPNLRSPGTPSAYRMAHLSTSSALSLPRELPVPTTMDTVSTPTAPSKPLFETKENVLRQLDRMQLSNEEALVRNKIIDSHRNAQDGDMTHRALTHVAAAQQSTLDALGTAPAPLGGYGSVTDAATGREDLDRWREAGRSQMLQGSDMDATAGASAIRRWATANADRVAMKSFPRELPAQTLGSSQLAKTQEQRQIYAPTASSLGYDARRKWGSVSFVNGNDGELSFSASHQTALGAPRADPLTSLSRAAAQYMDPATW